jgi:hypothetical protein
LIDDFRLRAAEIWIAEDGIEDGFRCGIHNGMVSLRRHVMASRRAAMMDVLMLSKTRKRRIAFKFGAHKADPKSKTPQLARSRGVLFTNGSWR